MPARTINEWHCARCGAEEAIERGRPHGWRIMVGMHGYQGNPKPTGKEPYMNGDLCPDCAASLQAWWLEPKERIRERV